jgi:hypothetical protein
MKAYFQDVGASLNPKAFLRTKSVQSVAAEMAEVVFDHLWFCNCPAPH